MELRCRNGNAPNLVTPCSNGVHSDFILTTQRELDSFYLLRFAFGPAISAVYIFFPLLIAVQGKYSAAGSLEGIVWKRGSIHGESCGDFTTSPEELSPFQRPEKIPANCVWFPNNSILLELGVHYAAFVAYAMALMLLCAGMAIWVLSPFADGGVMRQHILHTGLLVWPMLFLFMLFSGDVDDLWVTSAIGMIAGVLFLFSLKAVLNGYVPLLIGSHPDVIGVELLASPRSPGGPLSFRSISAFGRYTSRDIETQEKPDDMISILMAMVTPRANHKVTPMERPAGVPKLDLAPVHESENMSSPVPALHLQGGLATGRLLEMEGGGMDVEEEYGNPDQIRIRDVVEKLLTHAASAEISGQGAGITVQIFIVLGILWCFPETNDVFPYLIPIAFAALWAWAFGIYGFSGLKARTTRSSIEGFSCMDSLLVGVKRIAVDFRSLKDTVPNLFRLQLAQTILNVVARALQMMGAVFLVAEFGFRPSKVALMVLVYGIATPFSSIVSYVLVGLSAEPGSKLNLLKVFATMFTACPVWIYLGMHSSIEIVACTVATSVLTALTPTIIWGLQSDMAPCGYMTKVVSASGAMEALSLWVGPLLVGLMVDLTGSLRFGILTLSTLAMISIPLLFSIDTKAAMKEKEETEGSKRHSLA